MTDQPATTPATAAATDDDAPNEILAVARDARDQAVAAAEAVAKRARSWPIAGISLGVGIGSAAVAAAVLFASRDRRAK